MKEILVVLLAVTMVCIGLNAHANIISTTGAITKIDPPESVAPGSLEHDTVMHAFNEVQNYTLQETEDISVNITAPGTYDEEADLTPGVIHAGKQVCSHFLHSDPVGVIQDPDYKAYEGTATFDQKILGLIVLLNEREGSDNILGAPDTDYTDPGAMNLRPDHEYIIVSQDMKTITVHTETNLHVDQIRVITDCTGGVCMASTAASSLDANLVYESSDLAKHLAYFLLPIGAVIGLVIWRRKR